MAKKKKIAKGKKRSSKSQKGMSYADSGVDIEANDIMVDKISSAVKKTHGPRVMHLHNAFAGLFRLDYDETLFKRNYKNPVLVACTDGVGTKIKIAAAVGTFDTVGIDLVAMSVNDMLVQGAEPLFFLDYIAVNELKPAEIAEMVSGIAAGCVDASCALIGGETAEMPGIYTQGEFDMAGFAVGVVEKDRIIRGQHVEAGDSIIGLASSGIHSNGYSLVRNIVDRKKMKLDKYVDELGETLGEALLEPTRIYVKAVSGLLKKYRVKKPVKAMAHITGGGLVGNIPRVLDGKFDAVINRKWDVPPIFDYLQKHGPVEKKEMYRVFNMGIGYVLIVAKAFEQSAMSHLRKLGETPYLLGKVKKGSGQVHIKV